jgi:hypothetical protein
LTSDEKINESESEEEVRKKSDSEPRSKLDHIEPGKTSFDDIIDFSKQKSPKKKMTVIGRTRPDSTFEFPAKSDGKPPIQPWEIDTAGRLLAEKSKNRPKTQYERWIDEKRKEEGTEVICPACGAVNYDLLLVSGEKCVKCGFNYDSCDDLGKQLGSDTQRAMQYPVEKQQFFSELDLVKRLALPEDLASNPDRSFRYTFRTYSYLLQLLLIPCFIAGISIIYLHMQSDPGVYNVVERVQLLFWYYASMLVLLIFAISCLINFLQTCKVTSITVDHGGAVFYSTAAKRRINYSQIISIDNERRANGWTFFSIFNMGEGLANISPAYFGRRSSMVGIGPDADIASSSRSFTNNIRISTTSQNVTLTFTGGENGQFVQALAIIIFMTRKKNPSCNISSSAIKAAEKGYEDYSRWLRDK